jgi:hypothetical protein
MHTCRRLHLCQQPSKDLLYMRAWLAWTDASIPFLYNTKFLAQQPLAGEVRRAGSVNVDVNTFESEGKHLLVSRCRL